MRGCMMPMSSPMMKRMLGFCCCWADAGGMAAVKEAAHASAHSHLLCLILIGTVLRCPVATQPNSERAVRGRYSAHRCERQFRGDTHLTFLFRVSRPTPCFSYSTHVFNFNIALRCMCLREDLDQKSSPRSNWAVWEYTRKSCARVVPRPLGDVPVGAYDSTRLSNIGIGHGAIDAGVGYTYFNEQTGYEFSAVAGLTYNFINPYTQYQSGVDVHLDWGASRFLTKQLQIGLAGYLYNQASCDGGSGDRVGCFQSRVAGAGGQLGYTTPM